MTADISQSRSASHLGRPLVQRAVAAVALLSIEYLAIALRFDGLMHRYPGPWQELTGLVTMSALGLTGVLALYSRQVVSAITAELSSRTTLPGLAWPGIVHASGFAAMFATAELLAARQRSIATFSAGVLLIVALGLCSLVGALLALFPPRSALSLGKALLKPLTIGILAGFAAFASGFLVSHLWSTIAGFTLTVVAAILRLFSDKVQVWPEDRLLGLDDFVVEVARECSGIEGMGLILFFLGAYMWTARRQLRFPQALILLPLGMLAMYLTNLVRILVLVVVGAHISPEIALGGFHSKAGWVFFCVIALSLLGLASRFRYVAAGPDAGAAIFAGAGHGTAPHSTTALSEHNPTAVFLMPLLAIIAAYLVTGLFAKGPFDPYYGLRVAACGVALFVYRRPLRRLPRHWSPYGPLAGAVAFGLWMWLSPRPGTTDNAATAAALAALPAWAQMGWLALRVCGAVLFVPLAEELAFRGFLYRRILSADFADVPLGRLSWLALALSSAAFGTLHSQYVAGTIVGLLYGLIMVRRGSLLDAVIAHGVTNALLSAYVLFTGKWAYW